MSDRQSFTGRKRRLTTDWRVKFADTAARALITIGGIGTIVAVTTVFVFLAYVVVPLFYSAKIDGETKTPIAWSNEKLLKLTVDEYQVLGWVLTESGKLLAFRADTGEIIERKDLFPDAKLTAASFDVLTSSTACGFADGTVREGEIGIKTEIIAVEKQKPEVQAMLRELGDGEIARHNGGIVQKIEQDQYRYQKIEARFDNPLKMAEAPIRLVDHIQTEKRNVVAALTGDNKLLYTTIKRIVAIDGTVRVRPAQKVELPYQPGKPYQPGNAEQPLRLLLMGAGDTVLLAHDSGRASRFDVRDVQQATLAEDVRLVHGPQDKLTALELLLGRTTLICGDSSGRVDAWFAVRFPDGKTVDGLKLERTHPLHGPGAAVTALTVSARGRVALAGFADGSVKLLQVTTERQLVAAQMKAATPVTSVAIAPKDNGLFAATGGGLWRCELDPKHHEVTVAGLFLPVWYEGYEKVGHTWQSTGGTDDFEPKLGLWPLVFGTLKATFYSMLFGAPLALLAAIYTSEFMHPRLKAKVKPTIELMASLPSVVLGFLAGNIIAKMAEDKVPHLLTAFVAVPLAMLCGAFLWQQLPRPFTLRYSHWRLPVMFLVLLPLGIALGWATGSTVERWLFAGDMMLWLDGQQGTGVGGWLFLLLPLSALLVALILAQTVNPWMRSRATEWSHERLAAMNLVKFAVAAMCTLVIALLTSHGLTALGFDPRGKLGDTWIGGSYVDTFVQRNALIVGFIMGFAIIPIIYTIAEDALSTVPEHLRSASLGSGATAWQTAVRVVVPTAMSGLFAAMMVGLGRAVGETMIVLMAAGNTPVLDMNLFNGFRTLAANIAVELPEASKDSTHYRVLFLAALVLFVITFCVNTVAEIVRLRFRRRAYQL